MNPRPQRPEVIANRIRQKRQVHGRAVFLIVEGDDDAKLFSSFVDRQRCRIQPAYGRPSVEAALAILEDNGFWGVLAIVDTDFDLLEGRAPARPSLLRTDMRDIECMMLASPALDRVLREHGDEDRIEHFETGAGVTVREHLLALAETFGYLRWLAHRQSLAFRFEGFPFHRVIARKTFQIDAGQVLGVLQEHSRMGTLDHDGIAQDIEALRAHAPDLWQLCSGHDMVALLALGLQYVLGQRHKAEVKRELLEKDLRLAYDLAYFAETALCRALREWHETHAPILVPELAPG